MNPVPLTKSSQTFSFSDTLGYEQKRSETLRHDTRIRTSGQTCSNDTTIMVGDAPKLQQGESVHRSTTVRSGSRDFGVPSKTFLDGLMF